MCLASPEKAQATVSTFPGSTLMSSGRASILGAEPGKQTSTSRVSLALLQTEDERLAARCFHISPMALKEDPSRREDVSPRLLELTA